nr:structural protein [Tolivirales sp. gcode 6]
MGYTNQFKQPAINNTGTNIVVRHKELIQEVNASSVFVPTSLRINPGEPGVFPWLSGIASRYEKYKFKKLRFTLVPQVPTTQAGSLGLYFDYDPTEQTALTASSFFSNMNAVTKQIWMEATTVAVPQSQQLYVSEVQPKTGENLKWYDYGRINYFLQSPTNATAYLFAEYEVELSKPQISYSLPQSFEGFAYWSGSPLGNRPLTDPQLHSGVGIVNGGYITVPINGLYEVTVLANSNDNAAFLYQVCDQDITRMPLGVDQANNPIVQSYTFVLPLDKTVAFQAFRVSTGTIDCNAFPDDDISWLGVSFKLLKAVI